MWLWQFLDMTLKTQFIKELINWTSSKLCFCSSKDTEDIKRIKRHAHLEPERKYLQNTSDKGLLSRIC